MDRIQWEILVPVFKNRFFLQGAGIAFGVPFGIVVAIILITSKGDVLGTDAKYSLSLIGLLFVVSFVVISVVYGGKYAPGFIIDNEGITNYTQAKHSKRNKIINNLLIVFGALSGKPSAVGTGMIASSRQVINIKWKNIRKIKYYPEKHTILVWGGFAEKIAVFCTSENYVDVEAMIREKTDFQ